MNKDIRDRKLSVGLGVQSRQVWLPGEEGLSKDVVGKEAGVEVWGLV